MPEILEVEQARLLIEAAALGRAIAEVDAPDAWFLKRGLTPRAVRAALPGRSITKARRRGKLLLLDTGGVASDPKGGGRVSRSPSERDQDVGVASDPKGGGRVSRSPSERDQDQDHEAGPVVGMHLGMSGRVLIDGEAAGDPLVYASNRDVAEWNRFTLRFADGGRLALRDPRRLGAVELDPDEDRLGVDAFDLTLAELRAVVAHSHAPLKALLLNQSRIAGLGNLLVDEALWRVGLDPARAADSLDSGEQARLSRTIRTVLGVLGRRGGSHTGDLMPAREPGGHCPRDGAPLLRRTVGGRTTYSCPAHQH